MKAHRQIANAGFGPDDLQKVYAAFDAAWDQLAHTVSSRPDVVEGACIKLADIIIGLARRVPIDQARLTNAAVQLVLIDPMKLLG